MTKRNVPVTMPDYEAMTHRLRRIEGQVRALITMIEDERDCADVVNQLAAVKSAFDSAAMHAVVAMATHCTSPSDGTPPTLTSVEFRKLASILA